MQQRRYDVYNVVLVYLMLILNIFAHFSSIFIAGVEQINACWVAVKFE